MEGYILQWMDKAQVKDERCGSTRKIPNEQSGDSIPSLPLPRWTPAYVATEAVQSCGNVWCNG